LPPQITGLEQLTGLSLNNNRLTALPSEIAKLKQLSQIWLANNRLDSLPPEIGALARLQTLELRGNPLSAEVSELAKRGTATLLAYYRGLDAQGTGEPARRLFSEAKLLFVGPGEVGKSWLLQALQGEVPKAIPSTKGIDIERVALTVDHPTEMGRRLKLNCWDFGGQALYQITHQIFFSPKAIYLLVWKPRPGFDPELETRLERIQISAGATARVFIVSTHAHDNVPATISKEVLQTRFGGLIAGIHAVDSKRGPEGTGIAALRAAIGKAAAGLDGMDTPYPKSWVEAQEEIREVDEPAIPYSRFGEICARKKLDASATRALAIVMTVQGHCTYFEEAASEDHHAIDAPENMVVLRPEWLAKAASFVLEDALTREASGILGHARLPQIWSKDERRGCPGYADALHRYFLWLMWKFDIAYRQTDASSLVPELIHRNQPDDLLWTPSRPPKPPSGQMQATLICRLKQDPPPGLVPVLTAATYPLRRELGLRNSDRLDRNWRTGLFLDTALRGAAFIEYDSPSRELRIVVRHGYPATLLQQVRRTLERIIDERWPNLCHDYAVPCISTVEGAPCAGRFKYEFLERRLGKFAVCEECEAEIEVSSLLHGFDARGADALESLRRIEQGQADIARKQDSLMAMAVRIYRDLINPHRDEILRAPCMLTVLPEDVEGWKVFTRLTESRVRVTCWCEHPDGPHPNVLGSTEMMASYVLKAPKAWVVAAAPYVSWVTTLLKAFIPLTGTVIKQGLGDLATQRLKNDLDLMGDMAKAIPPGKLDVGRAADLNYIHGFKPEIESLRHIHDVMLEQWPKGPARWGLLRPVPTKMGEYLWLCPHHAAIQSPPVPELLA
jgi:hypothetical protein